MIIPTTVSDGALRRRSDGGSEMIPQRINVAINVDMLAAIDRVIEREQVSLTEAVRRLVTYGELLYRSSRDDGATIVVKHTGGLWTHNAEQSATARVRAGEKPRSFRPRGRYGGRQRAQPAMAAPSDVGFARRSPETTATIT